MDVLKDKRFSGIVKDPRFKKIPTKCTKTKIDKRFHGLFSSKDFNEKHSGNKRGLPHDGKNSEDYRKFYQLDATGHEASEGDIGFGEAAAKKSRRGAKIAVVPVSIKSEPCIDEDGSTTDTETSDAEQENEIDHNWQELDADAPRTNDITRRLAVCHMDWDRLRAEDLFVVFNSFKPTDGVINSVKIYSSEFGLERMEKEKLHGPAELIEEKLDSDEGSETSGAKTTCFHREKLRQYQINRLKYFFAVVDCDSPVTADSLYKQLDGMEFESSGCIFDLRFIPDDMTFEQEPVTVATSVPCLSDYRPRVFVTSALSEVNVNLTWDETDPRRKEVMERAFTDPESVENDIREYLASPSESEDETEELRDNSGSGKLSSKEAIARYKALVKALEIKEEAKQSEEEFDMEITWEPGLKEKTEKLVKEKALKENLTPFEEKLKKEKELKKLKKENIVIAKEEEEHDVDSSADESLPEQEEDQVKREQFRVSKKNKQKLPADSDERKIADLSLLMSGDSQQDPSDSEDLPKKKRRKKNKEKTERQDSSVVHIDDPRFAALYTDPEYHIDPSRQNLKPKKNMYSSWK